MTEELKDQQLLARLAAALDAHDPLPESVIDAAKASFTWRTIDAELASLVFDSAAEELAGVRSADASRQMTFRTPGVEIELVVVSETSRRLVGQLVPPQAAEVTLHHEQDESTAQSDSLGRFTFNDVPTGSVRLTCKLAGDGGAVVQTEWTII
ncbi:MAG: hypothetical protein QNL12_11600 [Acidimicrobiia bacterium]|nr:hypothetical protein [Acidimicrobiia bacterium]MDX2467951.1 hypothetical protein [Acidimicrobiia bacterium]